MIPQKQSEGTKDSKVGTRNLATEVLLNWFSLWATAAPSCQALLRSRVLCTYVRWGKLYSPAVTLHSSWTAPEDGTLALPGVLRNKQNRTGPTGILPPGSPRCTVIRALLAQLKQQGPEPRRDKTEKMLGSTHAPALHPQ